MSSWVERWGAAVLLAGIGSSAFAQGGQTTVYRCPGPPILYTDAISSAEAKARGCRTIEGAPITVMQTPKGSGKPAPVASSAPRSSESKVDPKEQQARDSEARRILEAELRREEERLAELQKEYNGGEPERQGNEQNYAKYQERVAGMKASIARKEADIAAIKRELAKLP
jgi:hypothetical protein